MKVKKIIVGIAASAMLFQMAGTHALAANENVDAKVMIEQEIIQSEIKENIVEQIETEITVTKAEEENKTETKKTQSIKAEKTQTTIKTQNKISKNSRTKNKTVNKKTVETKTNKQKKTKSTITKSKKYSASDLKYLACVIYTESGNQPQIGKIAVGNVVMNRVKSSLYPNTIYKVIHQKSQFGVVRNGSFGAAVRRYESGRFNSQNEKESLAAAKEVLEGKNVAGKRLSFTRYTKSLARRHPSGMKISAHYFY